MRKFVKTTTLLVAAALTAISLSAGIANAAAAAPKTPDPTTPGTSHHAGANWAFCGIGSAAAEIIGSTVNNNDKKDPRQSTIFEAGWYAAVCPVMLPLALVVTATCPDNKATYEIARQAHRYGLKHQAANWTPFTNAYEEACRNGKLSSEFRAFLKANGLKLSAAYRRH